MRPLIPFITIALATLAIGAEAKEQVRTEIVTLSLSKGVGPYYYLNDGKVSELRASSKGISAASTYHGNKVLSLYSSPDELTKRPADGVAPKPVAQAQLPADKDRVLLIFSKSEDENKDSITLNATGISSNDMKGGDYRLFNMSKQQVLVVMNKQKAVVQPLSISDISDTSWKSDVIDMQVQLGVNDEDGPRRVYSSIWGHRPNRRTFLFIFDRSDEYRPIEIRCFYDIPSTKSAEAKPAPTG